MVQARLSAEVFSGDAARVHHLWSDLLGPAAPPAAAYRELPVCAGVGRIYLPARSHQLPARAAVADRRFCARPPVMVLLAAAVGVRLRVVLGVLELLGGGKMELHFSHLAERENLRDARAGVSWISAIRTRVLRHVRDRSL